VLDFYRIYIHLFGLMFISQKNIGKKEIILFSIARDKGRFGKINVTIPNIPPFFGAYQAILMLIPCY